MTLVVAKPCLYLSFTLSGIQQYLFLNNRVDNILTDANFEKFTECLNDKLLDYEMNLIAQSKFI